MIKKLGELLTQQVYSLYELLRIAWKKIDEVIDSVNNKTDLNGDHKGTWHGLRPTQTSEATTSILESHERRLNGHDSLVEYLAISKADKNEIWTMANMGQDIKEAMTGGSVAIVGEGSVLKDAVVDGQIVPRKNSGFKQISKNLFNPLNVYNNCYYTPSTGVLNTGQSASGYNTTTEWIETNRNTSGYRYKNSCVVFFDNTKTFISGVPYGEGVFTIPANAVYMRLSFKLSDINKFYFGFATEPFAKDTYAYDIEYFTPEEVLLARDNEKSLKDKILKVEDKITKYPFQENATFTKEGVVYNNVRSAILDVKLYGGYYEDEYYISTLKRNFDGVYEIKVAKNGNDVCRFSKKGYIEPNNIDYIDLQETNNSGITGRVIVDWTKIDENISYKGFVYKNFGLSKKCLYDELKTFNPPSNGYQSDIENPLTNNGEDMIWSWWIYPLAIRFKSIRDKTYIGYTDSKGYSGVASINNETGEIQKYALKKFDIDDHNACSVNLLSDGSDNKKKIMVVYSGGHNTDNYINIRISKKYENITEWEDEIKVNCGGKTTYAQTFFTNGKWYVFFRRNENQWCFIESVDGRAWSTPHVVVESSQAYMYYMKVTETTQDGLLRLNLYSNPNLEDTNIRMGFFDAINGRILDSDNKTILKGNIYDDNTIVYHNNYTIVLPITTGRKYRLLDVAKTAPTDLKILYCDFEVVVPNQTYRNIYKIYDNGTIKTICDGGPPFGQYSNYVGGMVFDTSNINNIYVSRRDTTDWYWYLEKWDITSNPTKIDTIVNHQFRAAIRPISALNDNKVIWQHGWLDGTVTGFQTDLKYKNYN